VSLEIQDPPATARIAPSSGKGVSGWGALRSLAARIWSLPLWAHAAALAFVLLALLPYIGTGGIVNSDEGAAIIQAQQLERGDGWITPYAFSRIDPRQLAFPLEQTNAGKGGVAAYAKHPAYPLLLAIVDRVGGVDSMFVLSILGTAVAALFAGLLAMRFSPTIARPSLWFVGVGSPLLFDSYQVIAHTLAAALAAVAVLATLRAVDRRGGLSFALVIACVAAAVVLRTEALFFAFALAVVTFAMAWARRSVFLSSLGAGILGAAVVVRVVEERVISRLLGAPTIVGKMNAVATHGFFKDRIDAIRATLLSPSYDATWVGTRVVIAVAIVLIVGALVARARPRESFGITSIAVVVTALSVLLMMLAPRLVPGLVIACPLVIAGLAVARRDLLDEQTPRVLFATFGIFSIAVLATEYNVGGGVEWGGRYFALGLPLACPIALEALRMAGRRLDRFPRRAAAIALVLVTAASSVLAVRVLRVNHQFDEALTNSLEVVTRATKPGDGGAPIVMTYNSLVGREMWRTFFTRRIIWPPRGRAGEYLTRLKATGVRELVFVSRNNELQFDRLSREFHVERAGFLGHGRQWRFAVLRSG
jgi:hypothetical protein